MAKITPTIRIKIEKIARKLTNNEEDFVDCEDEGFKKICEMEDGHTESYYCQYGYRRMQDYLRKERLYRKRNQHLSNEESERHTEWPLAYGKKTRTPYYPETD